MVHSDQHGHYVSELFAKVAFGSFILPVPYRTVLSRASVSVSPPVIRSKQSASAIMLSWGEPRFFFGSQ
jgi:hypothetical protein